MRLNDNKIRDNFIWDDVFGEAIVEFLTEYKTHETARTVRSSVLNKYINAQIADNELVEWTIALISNRENAEKGLSHNIASLVVGLTERKRIINSSNSKYRIRRLVSPRDEWIDLSKEEVEQALGETQRIWTQDSGNSKSNDKPTIPSGQVIRRTRPGRRGLLLLYVLKYDSDLPSEPHVPIVGLAISFPKSPRGEEAAVEYMVNDIYVQQEFGDEL